VTIPPIVGVFGISGVGKTRLVGAAISSMPGALHLQGSSLIKQGLAAPLICSEALRKAGGDRIICNQRLLIAMFYRVVAEHSTSLVIFDGHLLIDTENGLIEVPQTVIAELQPKLLVHVEADPTLISSRRHADHNRTRPLRRTRTLAAHQARSRAMCRVYAEKAKIAMRTLQSDDVSGLLSICQPFYEEAAGGGG